MAYLNFSETAPAAGYATRDRGAPRAATATGFSSLEWLVIGLARRDRLSSLDTPGRLSVALRSLFGLGTASRLADERLERLRRLAVLVWNRGWRIPESEIAAFLNDFSPQQLETLVASIGGQKTAARGRVPA